MIVIAPLIVSVVVRTYGWQVILGNGPTGILNWLLLATGFIHHPLGCSIPRPPSRSARCMSFSR